MRITGADWLRNTEPLLTAQPTPHPVCQLSAPISPSRRRHVRRPRLACPSYPDVVRAAGECRAESAGHVVYATAEVAVFLEVTRAWRGDVQRVQPHVPPAALRRSGRGVLGFARGRHAVGRGCR